jgi:hypothetical protein
MWMSVVLISEGGAGFGLLDFALTGQNSSAELVMAVFLDF